MSAKAIIVGKICTELTKIGNEKNTGVKFSVACRDGKETEFIDCVGWGKLAININEYTCTGGIVEIYGRLKVNEYVNDDKVKFRKTYVAIDTIEFISKKTEQNQLNFSEEIK